MVSPASDEQVTTCAAWSMALTRPMMNRLPMLRSRSCRKGATICSGKTDAPTTSGSIGLKVR